MLIPVIYPYYQGPGPGPGVGLTAQPASQMVHTTSTAAHMAHVAHMTHAMARFRLQARPPQPRHLRRWRRPIRSAGRWADMWGSGFWIFRVLDLGFWVFRVLKS